MFCPKRNQSFAFGYCGRAQYHEVCALVYEGVIQRLGKLYEEKSIIRATLELVVEELKETKLLGTFRGVEEGPFDESKWL